MAGDGMTGGGAGAMHDRGQRGEKRKPDTDTWDPRPATVFSFFLDMCF
jgi:hypothetical protein